MLSQSFLPHIQPDTQVLVLGSMPGTASIARAQYYAHPRNAFWPIMEVIFGIKRDAPYQERLSALNFYKVGLWDVYAECYRSGSLDASILRSSVSYNDFAVLFSRYPALHSVFFNGREAANAYRRGVSLHLENDTRQYYSLPSTSPANAGMSYADKLQAWHFISKVIHRDEY